MPHVIVKLWPGKSEQQKIRLARRNREGRNGRLKVRRRGSFSSHRKSQTTGLG
jgi:hypothetical protein